MKYMKIIVVFILLAALVTSVYFYLSNIKARSSSDESTKVTRVHELINRNIDVRYPPTPKELVTFFADVTKCLYNEEYTNAEFEKLGEQLYALYDLELMEENPWNLYLDNLQYDIEANRKKGLTISSFIVSSSTDVKYYTEDGLDYAGLHCLFTLRSGTDLLSVDHQFLLRKDEGGRWRILGWQVFDE
ncbi:MAG: hypothetical protein FWC09_05860 [Lachnospiraceae bacterium]|nr:hypothetical protein [Lachnospiraceae bacterium]